jgi:hypothetical protein
MIVRNDKKVSKIYRGEATIQRIYKGTDKVYEYLPIGYKECKYIKSTGTQYIDTGVKGNSEIKIDTLFEITNAKQTQFFFGSRQSVSVQTFCFLSVSGTGNPWGFRSDFNNNFGVVQTEKISDMTGYPLFHVIKNKNVTTIENNEFINNISYGSFTSNYNIYIFTVNNNNTASSNFSYMKLYSFKVFKNDILIQNLIPCLDNNDTPCMYDLVTKQTYYNRGTGTFDYELL